ncbi:MAG: hypothetical protein WAM73_16585, partial [Desulfobacterales bacterium]
MHKRREPLGWGSLVVFLAAIVLALALCALLLAVQGQPALEALTLLFKSAFLSSWAVEDCLVKSVPIFLCSLGVAIAFRLQVWNIGAEGQFALGAVGATWMALTFPELPWYGLLPAMLAMASLTGGLWGLVPALL